MLGDAPGFIDSVPIGVCRTDDMNLNSTASESVSMCMSSRLGEDATLFVQQDTSSAPLAVTQLESSGQADAEDDTMLLYRPSSFITLPKHSSPYALAKRAENARDYKQALYWHTQCIEQGIRVVSAVMDVVELFEKFGKEEEALGLMMRYEHLVPKERYHAFRRLYDRVKRGLDRSVPTGPRMLVVTLVSPRAIEERGMEVGDPPQRYSADELAILGRLEEGPLNVKLLDRLFPNPQKIESLAICEARPDTGSQAAYVQFENQTSAKKAMMTEKVLSNIQVRWAEKTVTMLPPPKHALVDARRVLDSERFITSPFDTSLMLYKVPHIHKPAFEDQVFIRDQTTREQGETPSVVPRYATVSRGVSIAADARAMQFTQKMIRAMRMLEEISTNPPQSEGVLLGEAYEAIGRFDEAFVIYANTAISRNSQLDQLLNQDYEVVDCLIRCAVIAAIWGGSCDAGCLILDCVIATQPSLELLSETARNLPSPP